MSDRLENSGGHEEEQTGTPWLEWTAAGLGLLLAVGIIGFIILDGVSGNGQPPAVEVESRNILDRQPGYTVEIRAINRSGSTAATVVVEGELKRDGETIETSETTFDYVPGHSERQGGLYFSRDPRQFDLELRPKGYIRP